jgi:hypothetical protein
VWFKQLGNCIECGVNYGRTQVAGHIFSLFVLVGDDTSADIEYDSVGPAVCPLERGLAQAGK